MSDFPGNILIVGLAVWFVYLLLRALSSLTDDSDIESEKIEPAVKRPEPPEWVQQIDAEAAAFREELLAEADRACKEKNAPPGESYDHDWDYQQGKRKRPFVRYGDHIR